MKHVSIKIHGRVQGVCFRQYIKEKVLELGIFGWAKNEPDGSIRIEAEGEEKALDKFISHCHKGPQISYVEKVDSNIFSELENFENFTIRF